ncbi:MAG: efflux RND transporter periplasmic adaptor subunit [Burkholderiaceae bacterium]|jgi:biotin carboxyl carrier protein|nr:efflux RND transporter periplasmic adaptor subunit [Burkholderiaceae bacterium]
MTSHRPLPPWLPGALALALVAAIGVPSAGAHEGEDHSQPVTAAAPVADPARSSDVDAAFPRREADGSVFLPKLTQYRIEVRTEVVEASAIPVTVELVGKVVAEPNAGGRVQSTQSGRIEAGTKGLPVLGQRVTKGEVLAFVEPSIGSLERANRQSELAALDAQLAIARSRAARYEQLDGAIPRKDVEAARIEVTSLLARRKATATGLAAREPLRAPVSGVVSATSIVSGQIVEPRELLIEIVDPSRLAIEALAYDPAVAAAVSAASASVGSRPLELELVGVGRQLRGQALPLLFRASTKGVPLAIGQPLQVIARTTQKREGFAVGRQALVRDRSGEQVVWVHEAAERFVPRRVVFEPLDADTVVVTSGLAARDRVVVKGANLLAQVR